MKTAIYLILFLICFSFEDSANQSTKSNNIDYIDDSDYVNHQDSEGNTALHLCILAWIKEGIKNYKINSNRLKIVKLLIQYGALIPINNNEGKNAYELAIELNYKPLLRLMHRSMPFVRQDDDDKESDENLIL